MNESYTDIMPSLEDAERDAAVRQLREMSIVIVRHFRMTAKLVRKLRKIGQYIPPDALLMEMDRLADTLENYDPLEEIRPECVSDECFADCL